MTELEKIERAKMYMDKLANGINPIDDTMAPDDDLINNVRLSRCFFFVSDVLRQVIENGGTKSAVNKKLKKLPLEIPMEKRSQFAYTEVPIPASEIAKRINALSDNDAMQKLTYSGILTWLTEIGMMEWALAPDGKHTKRPTKIGEENGISVEERTSSNGPYQVVVYNNTAQHFIIDNLDAILTAENMQTQMQGVPWTKDHDDCLIDLYKKSVPVSEIIVISYTNKAIGELRDRINKGLGIPAKICTFHAFAYDIVKQFSEEPPEINFSSQQIIFDMLEKSIFHNKQLMRNLVLFLGYYFDLSEDVFKFTDLNQYHLYKAAQDFETLKSGLGEYIKKVEQQRTKKTRTITGEYLRSMQEVQIANFLYLNGLDYD